MTLLKNDLFSTKKPVFDPQKCPKMAKNHPKKHPQTGSPTAHSPYKPILVDIIGASAIILY